MQPFIDRFYDCTQAAALNTTGSNSNTWRYTWKSRLVADDGGQQRQRPQCHINIFFKQDDVTLQSPSLADKKSKRKKECLIILAPHRVCDNRCCTYRSIAARAREAATKGSIANHFLGGQDSPLIGSSLSSASGHVTREDVWAPPSLLSLGRREGATALLLKALLVT